MYNFGSVLGRGKWPVGRGEGQMLDGSRLRYTETVHYPENYVKTTGYPPRSKFPAGQRRVYGPTLAPNVSPDICYLFTG